MFEFTSTAVEVARQQLIWAGAVGGAGCLLLLLALTRRKSRVLAAIGIALVAGGGWYLYQSWELGRSSGEWRITVDDNQIDWQSPNEAVDRSFSVPLADILFFDRGARASRGDERPLYHLVLSDDSAIRLSPISGIDLESFAAHLATLGIETRDSGRSYQPVELRNR